jgi:hypothetical protein
MMHPDHRVEGEKCSGCGREWKHREGDGGVNGPLSCYHTSACPNVEHAPTGATSEASE